MLHERFVKIPKLGHTVTLTIRESAGEFKVSSGLMGPGTILKKEAEDIRAAIEVYLARVGIRQFAILGEA